MIQRIQSIYLLMVTILMVICMCNPIGSIITPNNEISTFTNLYITMAEDAKNYAPWALFVVLLIISLLALVTIFLFKKRMLQIRLTIFSSILLIGYYIMLILFVNTMLSDNTSFTPSWLVCLPFVALILNWLAIRSIGADEALVKAYDRLR